MKALVQRVSSASVTVDGEQVSCISRGLLILLGVMKGDTARDLDFIYRKICGLRIFQDADGKMNLSVRDIEGEALVVSQFTLAADVRKGNRPSFVNAEVPGIAEKTYQEFIAKMNSGGINTKGGKFAAMMDVALVNDGPVTIMIDSRQ